MKNIINKGLKLKILAKNLYFGIFDQIITNAFAPPITSPLSITCNLLNNSAEDFEVRFIAS